MDFSSERPPSVTSTRLASAMSHPTRWRAMRVLSERTATPREIAEEIDEPLNNVSYHMKILVDLDCAELVQVRSVHGGRVAEHVYRATTRPYFDVDSWNELDDTEKMAVTSAVMQEVTDDIAVAMSHGTFYEPDDNHLSRTPMQLDTPGWQEVIALLDEASKKLWDIQDRVNARRTPETEMLHTKVEILQFRSPAPKYELSDRD